MNWLRTLVSGRPHFVIGGTTDPYLLRWWLIPRNPVLNVFLHKFLRDDEDRALHDHPWWFLSLVLSGSYTEVLRDDHQGEEFGFFRCPACGNDQSPVFAICVNCGREKMVTLPRPRFSLAFRWPEHRHRVVLPKDELGCPAPCWTLIVTGPRVREWGFWCPRGFVPWKQFVSPRDKGAVGRGCD